MQVGFSVDIDIINGCIAGNAISQKELYGKYASTLYAICVRYAPNRDTASDYLQEAFIKIFKNLEKYRNEGSFEGWLKRLVVNNCLDQIKKLKSQPFEENIENAYNLGTENTVFGKLEVNNLMNLLEKLPLGYRTVFNLYAIEGYSHLEVAKLMGITESTSKSQLFKARKALQIMIEKTENHAR